MTSKEFVIWMRGFVAGSNNFNLTPAGWDEVKSELEKVNDVGVSIGIGGQGMKNGTITATPGYGSITYNPSTSTTNGYPSGSSFHYTNF